MGVPGISSCASISDSDVSCVSEASEKASCDLSSCLCCVKSGVIIPGEEKLALGVRAIGERGVRSSSGHNPFDISAGEAGALNGISAAREVVSFCTLPQLPQKRACRGNSAPQNLHFCILLASFFQAFSCFFLPEKSSTIINISRCMIFSRL